MSSDNLQLFRTDADVRKNSHPAYDEFGAETVTHYPCLKLNVPELYADKQFVKWLNSDKSNTATWHQGGKPNEYSDVFIWYENGEGSDSDMPEHCWDTLVDIFDANGFHQGVAWLTNLEI